MNSPRDHGHDVLQQRSVREIMQFISFDWLSYTEEGVIITDKSLIIKNLATES